MTPIYSWRERWARLRCRVLGHKVGEHPRHALIACCDRCGDGVTTEYGKQRAARKRIIEDALS